MLELAAAALAVQVALERQLQVAPVVLAQVATLLAPMFSMPEVAVELSTTYPLEREQADLVAAVQAALTQRVQVVPQTLAAAVVVVAAILPRLHEAVLVALES
jgi:hypothetical protein